MATTKRPKRSARLQHTTKARIELEAALKPHFKDGTRQLVVVIGSGLHRHLDRRVGTRGLSAWDALIGDAALTAGITVASHGDLTVRWESAVAACVEQDDKYQASRHERKLLEHVRDTVVERTVDASQVAGLRTKSSPRYRDLVTLNFDRTLDRILANRADSPVQKDDHAGRPDKVRQTIRVEAGATRIWHAHGIADRSVNARCIQLGVHGYASSSRAITEGLGSFRKGLREWTEQRGITGSTWKRADADAWNEHHRAIDAVALQWWHAVMTSNVAFIGCGLDRAELDLWLVLHERQRQLARVPETIRPKVFFIHPRKDFPEHVKLKPAGLTPVVTKDHDEGWRLLFGKSWG